MPRRGRPRLTPEEYQARLRAYCSRYDVQPSAKGLPPFPTGRRETQQHRDWIAVYKAHHRLARREGAARVGHQGIPLDEGRALLAAQSGRCPICAEKLRLEDSVGHADGPAGLRSVLHPECHRLVALAEALGAASLDRLRAYLSAESHPPLPHFRAKKVGESAKRSRA